MTKQQRKNIIDELVKKGFYRSGCLMLDDHPLLGLAIREGIVKPENQPKQMTDKEIYLANTVLFD